MTQSDDEDWVDRERRRQKKREEDGGCCKNSCFCSPCIIPMLVLSGIAFIWILFIVLVLVPQYQLYNSVGIGPPTPSKHPGQPAPTAANTELTRSQIDLHMPYIPPPEVIAITIVFHLLLILLFIAYFRAMCAKPGNIPDKKVTRYCCCVVVLVLNRCSVFVFVFVAMA